LLLKVRYLHGDIDTVERNLNGVAILHADQITDSMKRAMDETERRRARQIAFNEANGIIPKGVQKAMLNDDGLSEEAAKVHGISEKHNSNEIKRLEKRQGRFCFTGIGAASSGNPDS
jgi:excinuclease ABC subunit B